MRKLIPFGIPQYFYHYFLSMEFKPIDAPPEEPWVFDVEDLKFGFVIWLVSISIAVFGFLMEILWFNLVRGFIWAVGLRGFLRVVSEFRVG